MCHGSEGDVLTGLPEEPCLQDVDVPLQGERVNVPQLTQESCLCLITDLGSLQESVQRSHRSMVPLLDLAAPEPFGPRRGVLPCPYLFLKGHGGLEYIGTSGKEGLQLLQVCKLTLGIEPSVAQTSAHQRPVLALHVAVVILVVGTGTDNAPRLGQKGSGVKRIPWASQNRRSSLLMNSLPLSECRSWTGNGRCVRTLVRAANTTTCARLGTGTISVYPEQRSVTVRV